MLSTSSQAALYAQFEQAQGARKQNGPGTGNQELYFPPDQLGLQHGAQLAGVHNVPTGADIFANGGLVVGSGAVVGEDGLEGVAIDPNAKRIDEETGLEICEYHTDRIKHFFCMTHRDTSCRVCSEILHQKQDCMIVDLYEIEDMHGFLGEFAQNAAQQHHQQQQHDSLKGHDDDLLQAQQKAFAGAKGQ